VQLELNKRMLTAFNDKVFQLNAFESRPLGHWRNEHATATAHSGMYRGSAASSSSASGC
jgi:hypothetical protein